MVYTGYLRRTVPAAAGAPQFDDLPDGEFLLVTPGGGGDGDGLIDWVLAAYEHDPGSLPPAVLVFGPFMLPDRQAAFAARAARLPNVRTLTFDARLEELIGARRRCRRDGRLQHVLRDPVVRQAGADRAAHDAAARAVHPGPARRRTRAGRDAARRRQPRPAR